MKKIFIYNLYLSQWFAGKKKDKVISGTTFLFLNQVSFLLLAFSLLMKHFVLSEISSKIFTLVLIGATLIIMYGFQKPVQNYIQKQGYMKDLDNLSGKEIYFKRLLALVFFSTPFILCFLIAILFYR